MSYILLDHGGEFERGRGGRHAAPTVWDDRIRTGVRGTGQTLITLGVVVLLFVVYELWVTNIFNARAQAEASDELHEQWSEGNDPLDPGPGLPGAEVRDIPIGNGIAVMRIPAFGPDWGFVVVQGTDGPALDIGPGHYVDTALPGEIGNFAVAGHRVGKGSPFLDLDKLEAGDAIVVETKDYWYTYRVLGDPGTGDVNSGDPDGIPGRRIVDPGQIGVIAPFPGDPDRVGNRRLITLTTCHPKFSASQRMIIHGELDGAPLQKGPGVSPPALSE